jgi:hypothetical protein
LPPGNCTWTQQDGSGALPSAGNIIYTGAALSSNGGTAVVLLGTFVNDVYVGECDTSTGSCAWTAQTNTLPSTDWEGVAASADGQLLVAAIYNGPVYTATYDSGSSTWDNWTEQDSGAVLPTVAHWQALASNANGSVLVAAADTGDVYVGNCTADTGICTWTDQSSNGLPSAAAWQTVSSDAAGDLLAAAIQGGHIYLGNCNSGSGCLWVDQTGPGTGVGSGWSSIAEGADGINFVAVNNDGSSDESVFTFADGASFSESPPTLAELNLVYIGGNGFVAVEAKGNEGAPSE